ncbi:MAG: hypothetical protein JW784_03115 [Candidatus Cloacimonetes bacterium]|nr:hypothetical protein [Candidatus Cloacimonadota bacterium]
MKKIDLKSFLLGILVLALLLVILGSEYVETPASRIGKYQVAAAATNKTPKYIIIDTENGQIVRTGYIQED